MAFYIDAGKSGSSGEIAYLLKKCILHCPKKWTEIVFLCIGIFSQIFVQPESVIPAFILCITEKPEIPAKKSVDHRNGKCQDKLDDVKQIPRFYSFQFFKKCLFHVSLCLQDPGLFL